MIHCATMLPIVAIRCKKQRGSLLRATLRATALRDKLLRKLRSVTEPLVDSRNHPQNGSQKYIFTRGLPSFAMQNFGIPIIVNSPFTSNFLISEDCLYPPFQLLTLSFRRGGVVVAAPPFRHSLVPFMCFC